MKRVTSVFLALFLIGSTAFPIQKEIIEDADLYLDTYYELGKIYHQKYEIDKKNVEKAILYYERYLYLGGKEEAEVKESLKTLKKIGQ
jgi:hypothetical protein